MSRFAFVNSFNSEGKERLAVSSSQVTLQLKSVTFALLNAQMAN